jgi:hypothetical protein
MLLLFEFGVSSTAERLRFRPASDYESGCVVGLRSSWERPVPLAGRSPVFLQQPNGFIPSGFRLRIGLRSGVALFLGGGCLWQGAPCCLCRPRSSVGSSSPGSRGAGTALCRRSSSAGLARTSLHPYSLSATFQSSLPTEARESWVSARPVSLPTSLSSPFRKKLTY